MKNSNLKRALILCLSMSILFIITMFYFHKQAIQEYQRTNNLLLSSIIEEIKTTYPEVDELEIIRTLNNKNLKDTDILKKYGINVENEAISLQEEQIMKKYRMQYISTIFIYLLFIIILLLLYNKKEQKKINKITNYIKEINNQNYTLDIEENKEEDLSILKNEIYKTAVTLNEQSLTLKKEKESLKDSLSDISHQLKTPLTSITLMLDTLRENPSLPEEEQREILNNMHRKIKNTNFLVHSLLKLSKFDADTIEFKRKNNRIDTILKEVCDNLSTLSDLKDMNIHIQGNAKEELYCDYKWQVEALTNIVKNCLEHSENSSSINIEYKTNEIFTKITIQDYGVGIDSKDIPHIFERFYKGKNSSKDSIGIGLALAKAIIEKENGYITVESKRGQGTTFTIKYLK